METYDDKWQERKNNHLALSNAAAEVYDEIYEQANFATGSYMRYELEVIERFIQHSHSRTFAVDLGCGTGRDSYILSKYFDQVYACDFSSEMIRVAEKNKLVKRMGNVRFEIRDIEDGPLPLSDNSVSFLNTGFGMASFVKNIDSLFREVRRVLQPRGIAIFSFYNSAALVNQLELQWKPALAARVIEGEDILEVNFDKSYRIPAKAYQLKTIKRKAEGNFNVLDVTTFPTLSALFPQTLFIHETARELCRNVDQMLAKNEELAAGPYIVVVCQKGGSPIKEKSTLGYEKVLQLLRIHGIPEDIRSHQPVMSMSDVQEVLNVEPSHMVKSVLIAFSEEEQRQIDNLGASLYLFGLPADRKLHLGKVAALLNKPRQRLRLATQIEVETLTGFQVGSIPPFAMPAKIPVIIDERFHKLDVIWCGTGKSTESLRLTMDNLKKLSNCSFADISKAEIKR